MGIRRGYVSARNLVTEIESFNDSDNVGYIPKIQQKLHDLERGSFDKGSLLFFSGVALYNLFHRRESHAVAEFVKSYSLGNLVRDRG